MAFLPIAMGALSAAQGIMGRGAQAKADEANMNANAAAIRYSPWTHMETKMMQSQAPKGNLIGDIGGGVLSGIDQGQKMDAAKAANAKLEAEAGAANAQKDWYNGSTARMNSAAQAPQIDWSNQAMGPGMNPDQIRGLGGPSPQMGFRAPAYFGKSSWGNVA